MGIVSAAAYHSGRFLQEQDLLPESQCCPWCRFRGPRERLLAVQWNPDVWLLGCPVCHAVSTSRVATEAAIDAYYATYYSENAATRVTCGNPERHARHICRYTELGARSPRIALLDFGGGDGSISHAVALELARNTGASIDIVVVDYNARLVASANPRVTLAHAFNLEQVPDGRAFDIVLASAILEHLTEPAQVTRRLLGMMKAGGYFYARTPCMVPLLRLLRRLRISMDFTFPAHFHDLGQDFWQNVIQTLGMPDQEWTVVHSNPSLVETSFSQNFLRTLLSYVMKAPWWAFRFYYRFTGGWEVFIRRNSVLGGGR
jgi:SAM-dependent methyltransferase